MVGLKVLVTGARGFIGGALVEALQQDATLTVVPASRYEAGQTFLKISADDSVADLASKLAGVDVIIHSAGLAHIVKPNAQQLQDFHRVNCEFTEKLAHAAEQAKVTQFILLSSIGVNGEGRTQAYREDDAPEPLSVYAQSKYCAEQKLFTLSDTAKLKVTVMRMPLVYGQGCRGNMASLINIVRLGLPLPLAGVQNNRTLLSVNNLVDCIKLCVNNPAVFNKLYLLGDDESVSTPDIMRCLASGLGVKLSLFELPVWLLRAAAKLLGQGRRLDKLTGDLTVDNAKIKRDLQWLPAYSTCAELSKYGRSLNAVKEQN